MSGDYYDECMASNRAEGFVVGFLLGAIAMGLVWWLTGGAA